MRRESWAVFEGNLVLYLDIAADKPPEHAVLLVPAMEHQVAIVTSLQGDRGWLYRTPQELLRAVHVQQWLRKRGPVYFRPEGSITYYKASLDESWPS